MNQPGGNPPNHFQASHANGFQLSLLHLSRQQRHARTKELAMRDGWFVFSLQQSVSRFSGTIAPRTKSKRITGRSCPSRAWRRGGFAGTSRSKETSAALKFVCQSAGENLSIARPTQHPTREAVLVLPLWSGFGRERESRTGHRQKTRRSKRPGQVR